MLRDARFLREEFVPREVVHRDPEINHLSSVLQPLADGRPADTAFISGPSGSGKTCISKYTVERLKEENLDVESIYVNCWNDHSRFQVLFRILDEVTSTVDIHRQSTPRDVLFDRLRDHDGPPCVVILDEVDQLADRTVLYELLGLQSFSLVLIANDVEELLAEVDERLASRLRSAERIRFHAYTTDELVDILRERADRALTHDAIAPEQLEAIADEAGGDARVAIATLKLAARQADRDGAEQITTDHVKQAVPDAREELRQKSLDALSDHQREIYDIIEDHGSIAPGTLYEEYRSRIDNPKSDRTVRSYLKKMVRYNLIAAEGSTQDRRYRCVASPSPS
ncbi:Cdc6/Cdc18 family protein [Halorhabdus rudnickae]|uniref:Cdc6/Cdc18 family protein n=1 Tax=Halorhabdus rudnickae TaxID=1775544 RepID=UPI00108236E0|nr:Cdc6/Cdc18 family protein [Halorhabdus rudnickae]